MSHISYEFILPHLNMYGLSSRAGADAFELTISETVSGKDQLVHHNNPHGSENVEAPHPGGGYRRRIIYHAERHHQLRVLRSVRSLEVTLRANRYQL